MLGIVLFVTAWTFEPQHATGLLMACQVVLSIEHLVAVLTLVWGTCSRITSFMLGTHMPHQVTATGEPHMANITSMLDWHDGIGSELAERVKNTSVHFGSQRQTD